MHPCCADGGIVQFVVAIRAATCTECSGSRATLKEGLVKEKGRQSCPHFV